MGLPVGVGLEKMRVWARGSHVVSMRGESGMGSTQHGECKGEMNIRELYNRKDSAWHGAACPCEAGMALVFTIV